MYASLIGAGASQLYDLLRSQTQSSTSTSPSSPTNGSSFDTDLTSAVATDLQSVFGDLQKAGAGYHHAAASGASSSQAATATDPFQDLASSLIAYAKTQGLISKQSASTSLTA